MKEGENCVKTAIHYLDFMVSTESYLLLGNSNWCYLMKVSHPGVGVIIILLSSSIRFFKFVN